MNFTPQNNFEKALINAATNPSTIPQFYEEFIDSEIYLIQENALNDSLSKNNTLENKKIQIQQIELNGKMYIPIFSSPLRIQAAIKSEVQFMGIKVLDFLRATQGSELLLNPGSELGKEFSRNEILSILDGSIWDA